MADRRPASGFDALHEELPDDLTPHTGGLDGIIETDLVPCKVCDGSGTVIEWMMSEFPVPIDCPCTYRRPCDLLCRCSGGAL